MPKDQMSTADGHLFQVSSPAHKLTKQVQQPARHTYFRCLTVSVKLKQHVTLACVGLTADQVTQAGN